MKFANIFVELFVLFKCCFSYNQNPPRLVLSKMSKNPIIYPVGANIQLQCPVEADPESLYVEWSRNNEEVDEIGKFKITSRGHLRLKNAEVEDSGVYTCKAINGFGSTKANITVKVLQESELIAMKSAVDNKYPQEQDFTLQEIPKTDNFVVKTRTIRIIEKVTGKSLKLKCHVSKISKPTINWFKNDCPVDLNDLPIGSVVSHGTLFISRLRLKDKGNYTCIAFNEYSLSKGSFVVNVTESQYAKPQLVVSELWNAPIKVGDTVSFQCKVGSDSKPHIKWLKRFDREALKVLQREPITVDGEDYLSLHTFDVHQENGIYYNKLRIKNVQLSDSGKYLCFAANHRGYAYKSVYLTISSATDSVRAEVSYNSSVPIALLLVMIVVSTVVFTVCLLICFSAKKNLCIKNKVKKQEHKNGIYPITSNYTANDHVAQWLIKNHGPQSILIEGSSQNESSRTHVTAITL